ncbi:uncharacterized protein LOC124639700 isoform X2 [Helicoverpa zea]|uniref:uncharacterized protein LOC124639700 isoform X2 n=1 Tax=Helicoverpa zea TaxID=7113 RepID=UPI001F5A14B0|nr:uncharacterized protein LOC124639700 isoform X2 [Helicoverpa zea]
MWAVLKIIIVTFLSLDSTTWALEISLFKAANNWNKTVPYPQTNPMINHSLKHHSTYNVTLKICARKPDCIWKTIVKGKRVKDSIPISGEDDLCLKQYACTIEVDLSTITTEYIKQEARVLRPTGIPKPNSNSTETVIPDSLQPMECSIGIQTSTVIYIAVAMICLVILLAIIYVKKHRRHNARRVPPVNFQNSSSSNQVLYAELNLPPAPTDKPPTSTCEESPYTEIIGVLKPKPEVSKK